MLARLDGARRLLLQGSGAGPTGSRPFLDVLEVDSKATRRLWQSSPPFFETTSTILSDEDERTITLDGLRILATRCVVGVVGVWYSLHWVECLPDGGSASGGNLASGRPPPSGFL